MIGADVPPRRLRPQWLSGVEDTGGASEGLEAVQQVKVEELGGPAFVPNFDGAGWDPLWLPVVASETEFFVAGMAGFGDMVKIPLPHHSSGEPHPPLPCGERPASKAGGASAALALRDGMHDWFVIAAAVAAMVLAFMCCCHRRIRPRPPPPAQEESERPLLVERPSAPSVPAPPPPASSWRLATPLWGGRCDEEAPGARRDVSVWTGEPHESSSEYVTVTFVVPGS